MKAKLKKQLQSIAAISQDRVYFDVPDDLVDEMFALYDPADLYSYLTQKERNQAYRDMRGIGANSRQIQYEWKKKALWRIVKAKAWDELYELDESKSYCVESNSMSSFNRAGFMNYVSDKCTTLNNLSYQLINNIVCYGMEQKNNAKDQLVYFITDLVPRLDFGEVAAFCDDAHLTNYGIAEKEKYLEKMLDLKDFVDESVENYRVKSVFESILAGKDVRKAFD